MSEAVFQEEALGKAYDSRLMKRLLKYLRPYMWHTVSGAISILGVGGLQIALVAMVQIAIDDYIIDKDLQGLLWLSLGYLGVMLVKFGLEYYEIYITSLMGQLVQQDIRMQVFKKLQGMELRFFDKNPVGRLVTRVTNDINVLNEMFSSGVVNIIGDVVTIVGYVSLMLYYDWKLSLAVFAILPLLVVATIIFRNKVRVVYRELRLTIAKINAFLNEHLSGALIIKIFSQEKRIEKEFDDRNRLALDQNLKQVFYYAVFFPVVEFIGAMSLACLVVYGGILISSAELTFGELAAFVLLVERFYRPIRDLSEKYNILQASMASSERIFHLLDTPAMLPQESKVVTPLPSDAIPAGTLGKIEFENVTFAYNKEDYVLRDVSFTIEPGQTVAIVGATGSGKTTTISLLFRFYEPQLGVIRLDGKDIRDYDIRDLRNKLGLVLQDVQIFSGTIAENIRLGNKSITDERIRWAIKEVGFDRSMGIKAETMNIEQVVKERGATLSTGQKQLLSFARALAHDPTILALDEATSSVDSAAEILIQQALDKIMRNRTSLVVAHRLSTIERADKILVMHQGQLRESGTHSELLAKGGIYFKLYQMQYASREIGEHARTA